MTKEEYRAHLDGQQLHVCHAGGTEAPFTGKYYNFKGKGTYVCVACKSPLFVSDSKFDSGTGWPSFRKTCGMVEESEDGTGRIEVRCKMCDSHLGHVFEDGPPPEGRRYCINSIALEFIPCHSQ